MNAVALKSIVDYTFRTNPEYELVPFDRLAPEQRKTLRHLANDPDFYGILTPQQGGRHNIKAVSWGTARLLLTLADPGRIPAYARRRPADQCNLMLARLVLDGLLEISREGRFVCGSEAYDLIYDASPANSTQGVLIRLAQEALEYAQALDMEDCGLLSARLYFYNGVPVSPLWKRRFPGRETVARYLDLENRGANRRTLGGAWKEMKPTSPLDVWFRWEAPYNRALKAELPRTYKLYLSPRPEFVREAFRALVHVLADVRAQHFKIANDAVGLLRPDKMVIYFWDFETLNEAATRIATRLAGCPVQGVPFTAAITQDGLLSWGIDPAPKNGSATSLEWESWRLRITNRLATALSAAKRAKTNGLEPWRFALQRLRLEGVDTDTWTPADCFDHPTSLAG
jgi:hypothetical protein